MKIKISITLSEDVPTVVDQRATGRSRSEFIETALWSYDELISLPKSALTNFVGTLPPAKLQVLDKALKVTLDIPD